VPGGIPFDSRLRPFNLNEKFCCLESSGLWRRVVTLKLTHVSDVRTASIMKAMNRPDDGGNTDL
jgi:hypothetical protein